MYNIFNLPKIPSCGLSHIFTVPSLSLAQVDNKNSVVTKDFHNSCMFDL